MLKIGSDLNLQELSHLSTLGTLLVCYLHWPRYLLQIPFPIPALKNRSSIIGLGSGCTCQPVKILVWDPISLFKDSIISSCVYHKVYVAKVSNSYLCLPFFHLVLYLLMETVRYVHRISICYNHVAKQKCTLSIRTSAADCTSKLLSRLRSYLYNICHEPIQIL